MIAKDINMTRLILFCIAPLHYGLWIGLGGSLGIWVKIFISVIWLKQCRIVIVTYEHTLPVHMADFMAFEVKKSAQIGLFQEDRKISTKISKFFDYPLRMIKSLWPGGAAPALSLGTAGAVTCP